MSNNIIVTFRLQNNKEEKNYIGCVEDLTTLFFFTENGEVGKEFDVEFSEQIKQDECEIDLLFASIEDLKCDIGLLRNTSKVIGGTDNQDEFEIDKVRLSITRIVEFDEFDDIEYNPMTLEVVE